jgi:hypothetical protein
MSIDLTSPRHEGYRIHPDSGLFGAVIRGRPRHERIRDFDGTLMDKTAYLASVDSEMLDPERIVSESMKVHLYGTVAVVNGVYREMARKTKSPICSGSALRTPGCAGTIVGFVGPATPG